MSKKQERKKKDREVKAKERVLFRRDKLRAAKREADDAARMERHFRVKQAPFRNGVTEPAMSEQTRVDDPRKVEYIKQRLEHNMKILEALEAEMAKEEESRKAVNQSMEGKGAVTLREKFDIAGGVAEQIVGDKDWSNLTSNEDITSIPEDILNSDITAYMAPEKIQDTTT